VGIFHVPQRHLDALNRPIPENHRSSSMENGDRIIEIGCAERAVADSKQPVPASNRDSHEDAPGVYGTPFQPRYACARGVCCSTQPAPVTVSANAPST
jgi:hypothetical protein